MNLLLDLLCSGQVSSCGCVLCCQSCDFGVVIGSSVAKLTSTGTSKVFRIQTHDFYIIFYCFLLELDDTIMLVLFSQQLHPPQSLYQFSVLAEVLFQQANSFVDFVVLFLLPEVWYNLVVVYKVNLPGNSNISVIIAFWVRVESSHTGLPPILLVFFHHCLKTFEIESFRVGLLSRI